MLKFCNRNKGAISVFLTLILLPVLLLGGLTTDAARIYTSKIVISDAGEMAMNAGLAQYDSRLHDEYGLLVMQKSPESMESDLQDYFEKSLNGSGISGAETYDKILDLVAEQFDAINLEGSQIYKTEVEKQQIIEYMKYRAPVCLTELVSEKLDEFKDMKKMAEAMKAQMDFGEAMEDCQESMETAKTALDNLNDLINQYPSQNVIENELEATHQDYTIRVSRCLLMLAAISHYTEADMRGDAEESAKSFVNAAGGVSTGDDADSENSFNSYMNCLYYQAGVHNAGGLDEVLDEWRDQEPDEDDPDYSDWEERMDELEELSENYDSAKSAISGYPNQLRKISYEYCITPHTDTIHEFWEKSKKGAELAQTAYEKLEIVEEKLRNAGEKWEVWSEKTEALEAIEEGKSGDMKESVDEYGKFFADGDPMNDRNNLGLLMEDVKTDKLYFNEMRDILTEEKFFGKSIATVSSSTQYSTYLGQANAVAESNMNNYDYIEYKRTPDYISNYNHTTISTAYPMMRIETSPFYEKLKDYCSTQETEESREKKAEANEKLNESKNAGEEAQSENGYPSYTWTMNTSMPSVALGLVAAEDTDAGLTDVGGNVNDRAGRRDALSKFKTSIDEATSFLDGLDRIITDNLENLYVAEYAMQLFSYYTVDKKDGTTLNNDEILGLSGYKLSEHKPYKAEVEYILWGNASSARNVKNTIATIFGIRLLLNSFFAFTNTEIVSTSRRMALAIAGGAPYLVPVLQVLIELGFAGIETADDIGKIKDGYGVTIIKQPKYWKTYPTNNRRPGNNIEGITLDYSEFLRVFLNINMLNGKEVKKLARIADCIKVNTDFDMLNGYTMLAIEAKIKARTTFMKKVSDLGAGGWTQPDNTYTIQYQSTLGY